MANDNNQRDIVLDIGTYAFIRDRTGGAIKIGTGPNTITPSQSDEPVRFDPKTGRFVPCSLDSAVLLNMTAKEGSYIVLENPAADQKQPKPEMKGVKADVALNIGSKLVIPGPADFPLWPRQSAEVIEGHQLKSNQYLLCRVYNETLAKENWAKAIVRKAAPAAPVTPQPGAEQKPVTEGEQQAAQAAAETPKVEQADTTKLAVGQLFVVKGTDVSFYIPPSGIEVLKDEQGRYVRDALTLERMEYCILVDENGNKRFERGPQVVFPMPTETFQTKDGAKKQNAVELNDIQGLHLKAIADCTFNGVDLKAGQEYFLTGSGLFDMNDQRIGSGATIYYPREEIAFVKYDGKVKIFATTVPEGEGRYVLDRKGGAIDTVMGPKQLLPNPIKQVIVRRVLSEKQCRLWYPGNDEALAFNLAIAQVADRSPTTRAGAISEGDLERATKSLMKSADVRTRSVLSAASVMNYAGETSRVSGEQKVMGDEFERQSGYTAPRTLTLNTKYQGAVKINVWTGYAIQVVSQAERKVVQGPQQVLLDYDEDLEMLSFSTGKPKTTDNLLSTVYLQVQNNKVSDVIEVETFEGVKAQVYVSYLVNFEGDPKKWFAVSNYIKLMCDRARSMLKGVVRKMGIESFYTNSTDIVRDTVLGKSVEGKRPGLVFDENGMRVRDVDVLNVTILNPQLAQKLQGAQLQVVDTNIQLAAKRRELEFVRETEQLTQEQEKVKAETQKLRDSLEAELTKSELDKQIVEAEAELTKLAKSTAIADAINKKEDAITASRLAREKAIEEQRLAVAGMTQAQLLEKLKAETDAVVAKLGALKDGYGEILGALSERDVLVKMTEAQNLLNLVHKDAKSEALVNSIIEMRTLKDVLNGATRGAVVNPLQASTTPAPQPKA